MTESWDCAYNSWYPGPRSGFLRCYPGTGVLMELENGCHRCQCAGPAKAEFPGGPYPVLLLTPGGLELGSSGVVELMASRNIPTSGT
eukprot:3935262-Rhodomonas_salina.1